MRVFFLFVSLLIVSTTSHARKFSFENEGFSTYLKGTGGLSNLAKDAFGKGSGANTTFEDKVEFNFSGEIGIAISIAEMVLRIGVEGIVPKKLSGIEGKNSSGQTLFDLDSTVLGIAPTVSAEFALYKDAESRFMVGASVGQANVTVTNKYTFTAQGNTDLGVTEDYTETFKGTAIGGSLFAGIESLLTDNVTVAIDVGYRIYSIGSLEHKDAVTTINGDVTAGSPVKNSDGSDRTLNLTGLYVGLGLRFYIAL